MAVLLIVPEGSPARDRGGDQRDSKPEPHLVGADAVVLVHALPPEKCPVGSLRRGSAAPLSWPAARDRARRARRRVSLRSRAAVALALCDRLALVRRDSLPVGVSHVLDLAVAVVRRNRGRCLCLPLR